MTTAFVIETRQWTETAERALRPYFDTVLAFSNLQEAERAVRRSGAENHKNLHAVVVAPTLSGKLFGSPSETFGTLPFVQMLRSSGFRGPVVVTTKAESVARRFHVLGCRSCDRLGLGGSLRGFTRPQ